MGDQYLKKSDVMAELEERQLHLAKNAINALPVTHIPAPSNAVLKFEEGKIYRTRGGEKVFIGVVSDTNLYGMMEGNSSALWWRANGNFDNDGIKRSIDLISLWDEPAPESDTSKLLEMIDDLERVYAANQPIRARLIAMLREITRLLAERGDK